MQNKFQALFNKTYLVTIANIENKQDLQQIVDKIKSKSKNIEGIIVSEELHLDGDYHYHILIRYKLRKRITNPKAYNYILSKQTNISKVNSLQDAIQYVTKDKNFVNDGISIESEKQNSILDEKSVLELLSRKVSRDKYDLEKLVNYCEENGQIFVDVITKNHKSIKNMIHFMNEYEALKKFKRNNKVDIRKLQKLLEKYQNDAEYSAILGSIIISIKQSYNRPHKSLNLHLYSNRANYGKTTLLTLLAKSIYTYYYPPIQWFAEYFNYKYNLIIWDEFKFPKDIHHFNLFFEGAPVDLQVKYSNNITKTDNPLILCCSNRSIREQIATTYKSSCEECRGFVVNKLHQDNKCLHSEQVKSLISTTAARIKEIKLTKPLFPLIEDLKKIL